MTETKIAYPIAHWPGCDAAELQALSTADRPLSAFVTAYAAHEHHTLNGGEPDTTSLRGALMGANHAAVRAWVDDSCRGFNLPKRRVSRWSSAINLTRIAFDDDDVRPMDGLMPDPYQILAMRHATIAGVGLALGVGLGKTLTTACLARIVAARQFANGSRLWIFCPLNAFDAWDRFLPDLRTIFVDVRVLSIDSAHKYVGAENCGGVVVFDECFPAGTLVDTDHGHVPIEALVNHMLGYRVRTMRNGKLCWKSITGRLKKPSTEALVRVDYEGGSLVCTSNHPVWTENRGWVRADTLLDGDHLRVVRQASAQTPGSRRSVLLGSVHGSLDGSEAFGADEAAKPDSTRSSQGSDQRSASREAVPGGARWKRSHFTDRADVASRGSASAMGVLDFTRSASERLAEVLQGGLRRAEPPLGDRTGWRESSVTEAACVGSEEGSAPGYARVVRVAVLEPGGAGGHCIGDPVYCLEVEGTHAFFADGVLVHNCHMAGDKDSRRTVAAHAVRALFDFSICLTGTLLHAGVEKCLSVLDLIVPGMALFATRWKAGAHFHCLVRKNIGPRMVTELVEPTGPSFVAFNEWLARATISLDKHTPEVQADVHIPEQELHVVDFGKPWPPIAEEVGRIAGEIFEAEGELPHIQRVIHRICRQGVELKMDWLLSMIDDPNMGVVIFAQYRDSLDYAAQRLTEAGLTYVRVDGDISKEDRPELNRQFQAGEVNVFLGQTLASGIAINLFRTNVSVMLDHSWKAVEYAQALGRTCRRGQTHVCHHFDLYANSVQKKIIDRVRNGQNFDASCAEYQTLKRAALATGVPNAH